MSNEKFLKLMQDEEFVKKIVKMQTPEEVQNELKNEGVELSVEEVELLGSIINKSLEKNGQPLTEQDLLDIAGGTFGKGLKQEFRLPWAILAEGRKNNEKAEIEGAVGIMVGQGLIAGAGALAGAGVLWAIKDGKKIANFFKNKFKNKK